VDEGEVRGRDGEMNSRVEKIASCHEEEKMREEREKTNEREKKEDWKMEKNIVHCYGEWYVHRTVSTTVDQAYER